MAAPAGRRDKPDQFLTKPYKQITRGISGGSDPKPCRRDSTSRKLGVYASILGKAWILVRHALIAAEKKWYFPPHHAKRLRGGYEMAHEPIEFRINTEKLMRGGDRVVNSRTPTKDHQPGPLRAEERLYLSLLDTPLLNTTGFLQNKNLIRPGESFTVAYLIVSGEVLVNHAEKTYQLGTGAVIGLSEGIVGMASKYSATTNTFVEMKIIPFQKVVSIIKALPPELQAIIMNIVKRNLEIY